MKFIAALLLAISLGGCASLSEKECLTADWESIGYRDGSRGYDAGRVASHGEACSEYSISPDRKEYEAGRLRGLELFCTGRNGVQVGRQGSTYSGVCPAALEPDFLQGYDLGRQLNEFDQHLSELHNRIEETQRELRRKDPPLTDYERDQLLYRLRDLEREFGHTESAASRLERRAREF